MALSHRELFASVNQHRALIRLALSTSTFRKPWAIYAVTITTAHRRILNPQARTIILNAWRHFHNARYELFAICIMPDHVHALFQPWPKNEASQEETKFCP